MLSIPVTIDAKVADIDRAFKELEKGAEDALRSLVSLDGKKINIEVAFASNGEKVYRQLSDNEVALKKVIKQTERQIQVQRGSKTSMEQNIALLKKQRDALSTANPAYQRYVSAVKEAQKGLNAFNGVQQGSITQLRQYKAELQAQQAVLTIGSAKYNQLQQQIQGINNKLTNTKPKAQTFIRVLSNVAVAAAAFESVGRAIQNVGNAFDVYTRRQKQVEGFNLAIQNTGRAQGEANVLFKEAAATAASLGAPLSQVENAYKRMVPALDAVGASSEQTQKFIQSITARTQTLGLNTEQSGRLFEAFAQVLSKGKLQAEELNQQISELDGAFRTQFADALGVTTQELTELVSQGKITATVFVDTLNKMSNGVEALQKRIESGNYTIQQLQNLIRNLNTKNIEDIGAKLKPALDSFLKIQLAVAEFVSAFKETAVFETLVKIFNGSAKSLENFVNILLTLAKVVTAILEPIAGLVNAILSVESPAGNLVSILGTAVTAFTALGAVTRAIKFVKAREEFKKVTDAVQKFTNQWAEVGKQTSGKKKVIAGLQAIRDASIRAVRRITGLKLAFLGSGNAAAKAAPSIRKFEYGVDGVSRFGGKAAKGTAGLGKAIGGLINPVTAAIAAIGVLVNVYSSYYNSVREVNEILKGNQILNSTREWINESKEGPKTFEEITKSVEKAGEEISKTGEAAKETAGNLSKGIASGAGLAVANIFSIGEAFDNVKKIFKGEINFDTLLGATLPALKKIKDNLQEAGKIDALEENMKLFTQATEEARAELERLGVKAGKTDFSGETDPEKLREQGKAVKFNITQINQQIGATEELLLAERKKEKADQNVIAYLKGKIQLFKTEKSQLEATSEAISDQTAKLIANGNEAAAASASVKELAKAQKILNEELKAKELEARTEALKKYGKAQNASQLISAANIGIERQVSEEREANARKELQRIEERRQKNGQLTAEEKKYQAERTTIIATETNKQAQLEIDARNSVIDAFEKGIAKAQEYVNVLGQSASAAKGAFDGVSNSFLSGVQAAGGLLDDIYEQEKQAAAEGSQTRRNIAANQLRQAVQQNQLEMEIAQVKLNVQNKIAQSEARIAQLRLQAEASIAQARGDSGLATALREAAGLQGNILKGLQYQYEMDTKILEIEKRRKDNALIQKGISEGVGRNANETANIIGAQVTSFKEANDLYKGLAEKGKQVTSAFAKTAVSTQKVKEQGQVDVLGKGLQNANQMKEALDGAKGSTEGMVQVSNALSGNFASAADNAYDMYSYITSAVSQARTLAAIANSGGSNARALGGPVTGGQQYLVNDGGGREGFVSNTGKFSMLPAARNIRWTAPSSGTVIPANLVDRYKAAISNSGLEMKSASIQPSSGSARAVTASLDSGNLVKQMSAAIGSSGGNQRITNNVTIQSQQPVTDASQIMTNVARMRLRNSRRF